MWNKINSKSDLPDFKEVVYLHKCGSKGIGRLVWFDGEVMVVDKNNSMKSNYGYDVVAWLEIPDYV